MPETSFVAGDQPVPAEQNGGGGRRRTDGGDAVRQTPPHAEDRAHILEEAAIVTPHGARRAIVVRSCAAGADPLDGRRACARERKLVDQYQRLVLEHERARPEGTADSTDLPRGCILDLEGTDRRAIVIDADGLFYFGDQFKSAEAEQLARLTDAGLSDDECAGPDAEDEVEQATADAREGGADDACACAAAEQDPLGCQFDRALDALIAGDQNVGHA
jgi:hypothetical protein